MIPNRLLLLMTLGVCSIVNAQVPASVTNARVPSPAMNSQAPSAASVTCPNLTINANLNPKDPKYQQNLGELERRAMSCKRDMTSCEVRFLDPGTVAVPPEKQALVAQCQQEVANRYRAGAK